MLSEEDKHRIRIEENFRHRVAREITSQKFRSKVWRFFNSPFAIWSLSSIILAGIIAAWTFAHNSFLEHKHNEEKRIALAFEIRVRFTDFLKKCEKAKSPDQFWAEYSKLVDPQTWLTQFRDATMDELEYQYGLLPTKQDAITDSLHNGISKIEDLFSKGSGDSQAVNNYLKDIVNKDIIEAVNTNVIRTPWLHRRPVSSLSL